MPNELGESDVIPGVLDSTEEGRPHELKLEDDDERTSRCLFQGLEVRRIVDVARTSNFLPQPDLWDWWHC